jgi:hypothetical protein
MLEHFLTQLVLGWARRGATNVAIADPAGEGWTLRLCGRAKFLAWLWWLMFTSGLVGVLALQAVDPQPQRQFVFLLTAYSLLVLFAWYYLAFALWYRVRCNDERIELRRFLLPTRRMAWREMRSFRIAADHDSVTLVDQSKRKIGLYGSLNGLSAVRRCLAAFTQASEVSLDSWSVQDALLVEHIPSWRCDPFDLEDDPFDPLGTWRSSVAPDAVEDEPAAWNSLGQSGKVDETGDEPRVAAPRW